MNPDRPHRRIRQLFLPPLSNLAHESGHIILKDGTAVELRVAHPSDAATLRLFVDRLSPESKRHRFFSATRPPAEVIRSLCDSSDPHVQMTLIALRLSEGRSMIVAAIRSLTIRGKISGSLDRETSVA